MEPANVLMMSGESGISTLKKNLRTIYHARCSRLSTRRTEKGLQAYPRPCPVSALPKRLTLSDKIPHFDNKAHLSTVKKLLEETEAGVLIIDTASMAMPGENAPNLMIMQGLLHAMGDVCRASETTLILVHHTKKRNDDHKPAELADVAFSGFKEYFRQWMLLSRRTTYTPPEPNENRLHELWLNIGGSAGHSALYGLNIDEGTYRKPRWDIEINNATQARVETHKRETVKNIDEDKAIVLEALKDGTIKTLAVLRDETKLNGSKYPRLKVAIDHLLKSGMIDNAESVGENKQKYHAYKLHL